MNLKDALIKAYANQGLALPGKGTKGQSRQVPEAKNSKKMRTVPAVLVSTKTGERHQSQHLLENSAIHNAQTVIRKLRTVPEKSTSHAQGRITHDRPTTQNTVSPTKRSAPPKAAKPLPTQAPLVVIDPSSRCLVKVSGNSALHLLNLDLIVGSRDNITQFANPEVHEMALGLDFGTSCVKAVISDLAADVAYAVPFIRAKGIEAYLLPSRVFESNAQGHSGNGVGFSLNAGEEVFRDLKLNLLGNPDAVGPQIEVIAFLALVIQRTRAWLFHTHKSVYKRVKCLWQLRIGLPAATALDSKYVPLLERVLLAAWKVAAMECPPTRDEVGRIRESVFSGENFDHELEVRVIPEIVAQVFGFVVSSAFDKKADNRFLMVDVGAGTVDSCLFHVKPPRAGQWSFEFYTAVVQPYGVSNLHAHRVDWWLTHLKPVKESLGLSKAVRH